MAEAIDEHELLDREHVGNADLADVIMMANRLSGIDAADDSAPLAFADIPACGKLGLDQATCSKVVADAEEEIRSMTLALAG
jgi:hypothetical protein